MQQWDETTTACFYLFFCLPPPDETHRGVEIVVKNFSNTYVYSFYFNSKSRKILCAKTAKLKLQTHPNHI